MRCGWMAMLVVAACGPSDDIPDYGTDFEVTSDVPLDRIDVLHGSVGPPQLVPEPELAPITPGRRARGELEPELAPLIRGYLLTRELDGEMAAQFTIDEFLSQRVLVIGYQRDAGGGYRVVGAAEGPLGPTTFRITAAGATGLEVWNDARRCARVAGGPHYYVAGQDTDCDGITEVQDCNDLDHCALDAPTAEERAGCETVRCEPCLDRTPDACAVGSRAICRDEGVDVDPTVSCDGDAACGPAVCVPESTCRVAFTECFGEWPDVDPRQCLAFRWGSGLAAVDGIPCALPAEPHAIDPTGGLICPGGSTVEAALPFTDCSDPQVVIGDTGYEAASATIVPPCTVRLTLTPTEDVYLLARGALVTFTSADTSTSARFQLVATPGTCGTTGTCGAPPETSLCTN